MIKKAGIHQLSEIKSLTETCARAMCENGIYQWNEHYPSLERLRKDIEKEELYVYEQDGKISGIIVITEDMDEEYIPIRWLSRTNSNIYIHRLATHPQVWGQGYAQKMMDFAEDHARQRNFESVRLDTFSQNKRNQRFYNPGDISGWEISISLNKANIHFTAMSCSFKPSTAIFAFH